MNDLIHATVDERLAKGLRKRFEREQVAAHEAATHALLARKGKNPKNRQKWVEEFIAQVARFAGDRFIAAIPDSKQRRWMLVELGVDEVAGGYVALGFILDAKKRTCSEPRYFGCISSHCVERFFERVRRPFSFREVSDLLGRATTAAMHQRVGPDAPAEFDVPTPDGIIVCRWEEPEARMGLVLVTFLGKRELNDERYAKWLAAGAV